MSALSLAKSGVGVLAGVAKKYPLVAGAIGTYAVGKALGNTRLFDGDGNPFTVNVKPRRKKGLTYNEIRGAVKVLKLVKRFTIAGHKTILRSKPR